MKQDQSHLGTFASFLLLLPDFLKTMRRVECEMTRVIHNSLRSEIVVEVCVESEWPERPGVVVEWADGVVPVGEPVADVPEVGRLVDGHVAVVVGVQVLVAGPGAVGHAAVAEGVVDVRVVAVLVGVAVAVAVVVAGLVVVPVAVVVVVVVVVVSVTVTVSVVVAVAVVAVVVGLVVAMVVPNKHTT